MWVNKHFEVPNGVKWVTEFLNENTLSTIISHNPMHIAHMPVELYRASPQEEMKLIFHLPLVDPIAEALQNDSLVTIIVHGPQQYISPNLYDDVGLPTFNYAIAEISDTARPLDPHEVREHLHRLTEQREQMFADSSGGTPWKMTAEAGERFERLLPAVVAFELSLDTAQVKLKMGQNRNTDDRHSTVKRLQSTPGVNPSVTSMMSSLLQSDAE